MKTITHRSSEPFKFISFILFSLASFILSFNMYIQLVSTTYEKILMGGLNIAFESFKIYTIILYHSYTAVLLLYKDQITIAIKKSLNKKRIIHFLLYLFLALLSFVASFGFTLTAVYKQSQKQVYLTSTNEQVQILKSVIDQYTDQIKKLDDQIALLQKTLDQLPPDFITRKQQLSAQIEKYLQQRNELLEKKQEKTLEINNLQIKEKEARTTVSRSMFDLMGEILHISGYSIMFYILAVTSLFIEVGVFITSPQLNFSIEDIQQNKQDTQQVTKEIVSEQPKEIKRKKRSKRIKKEKQEQQSQAIDQELKKEEPIKQTISEQEQEKKEEVKEKQEEIKKEEVKQENINLNKTTIENKKDSNFDQKIVLKNATNYKRELFLQNLINNPKRFSSIDEIKQYAASISEINVREADRLIQFLLSYVPQGKSFPLLSVDKSTNSFTSVYPFEEIKMYLKNLNIL